MILSLPERLVILDNGCRLPITNMLDEFGDETSDIKECCSIVAGPMQDGQWLAVVIGDKDRDITYQ